jgi:putative oxidoreductase
MQVSKEKWMTSLTQTQNWKERSIEPARWPRVKVAFVWILQVLSAAMFLFAGTHKLTSDPAMVQAFAVIGVGQWFRYLTGAIEVVSAVLLLIPSLALFGALALAVTMVGAVITHLFIIGGSPVAALVLLASTAAIAWIGWGDSHGR